MRWLLAIGFFSFGCGFRPFFAGDALPILVWVGKVLWPALLDYFEKGPLLTRVCVPQQDVFQLGIRNSPMKSLKADVILHAFFLKLHHLHVNHRCVRWYFDLYRQRADFGHEGERVGLVPSRLILDSDFSIP